MRKSLVLVALAGLVAGIAGCSGTSPTSNDGEPEATESTFDVEAGRTIARWPMDDKPGSEMHDASGNHRVGIVGVSVERSGEFFDFPEATPGVVESSRLITIADSPEFDVAEPTFTVSMRIRMTSAGEHNIVQKGQSQIPGGFWKVEVNANGSTPGVPHCEFKGSSSAIGVASNVRIDDGEWHLLACQRTSVGVAISVDGDVEENEGATGAIANTAAIVIGGKAQCGGASGVECDYFVGDLADMRIGIAE